MKIATWSFITGVILLGFNADPLQALDGRVLYNNRLCVSCHGVAGREPLIPLYPRLDGQSVQYLINQIRDIKAGRRANGLSSAMVPVFKSLSDAEIKAIASYLSKQ